MSVIIKGASGNTVVANGGWTNPANAQTDYQDSVFATVEPAVSTDVTTDFTFPAFTDSEIPAGSTINSVKLMADFQLAVVTGAFVGIRGYNNAVADSAAEVANLGGNRYTFTYGTIPSVTDLKTAGRIAARVRAHKDTTAGTLNARVDDVVLVVDFTPPTNGNWSFPTAKQIGPDGGTGHTGRSLVMGTVNVGDVIFVVLNRSATSNDFASDTITDNLGNTYTLVGSTFSSTDSQGGSFWRCTVTAGGSCTITSAYAAGASRTYDSLGALVVRPAAGGSVTVEDSAHTGATAPSTASGTGEDTASVGPVNVPTVGDLVVVAVENVGGSRPAHEGTTPDAFTADVNTNSKYGEPGADILIQHAVLGTTGSRSPTFSIQQATRYAGGAVVLKWAATATTQFSRPSADAATGGWIPTPGTPTTLYDKIDETTASDTDYISATAV